jgi:RimJ/RimL family protein N-acetyltransferase
MVATLRDAPALARYPDEVPVSLRPIEDADLPTLFEQQRDRQANADAAFGPADPDDRAALDAHWVRILADPSTVTRAIDVGGRLAGSILRWRDPALDAAEVSYWLGREFWGRGVASQALAQFVEALPDRRLYGRTASTNPASGRVLEKCGFRLVRVDRDVTATNGRQVDELIMRLDR